MVFLIAGVNLSVDWVVVLELAFDFGLRQVRRKGIFDADALEEGDEAHDVESEVGSCQQVVSLPGLLDQILSQLALTDC